jgi:CRISPR/Cas system-associated exonuclease Cas4 (RecB family)
MVPVESRQHPHVSFTQIDQYLRCPLKYRFTYVDRLEPDFVPAALAFGSGIHRAAAFFFHGLAEGERRRVDEVQGFFETSWKLETTHRPLRFGERDTRESLLDLGRRMLGVLCESVAPGMEVVAVEQPFSVPLVNVDTGELIERDLVGSLDLLERDAEGLVVVDLKTSARKYTDLQVEASLQLSVYSYAVSMSEFANGDDVRLRFDVLTKTRVPELHRYWTTRDRAASVRLFRLASEVLAAIEAGVFHPNLGWQCRDCQFRSKCWAWG